MLYFSSIFISPLPVNLVGWAVAVFK
ncbi:cytochrome PufQ [Rouxiella sp. Mn2063]